MARDRHERADLLVSGVAGVASVCSPGTPVHGPAPAADPGPRTPSLSRATAAPASWGAARGRAARWVAVASTRDLLRARRHRRGELAGMVRRCGVKQPFFDGALFAESLPEDPRRVLAQRADLPDRGGPRPGSPWSSPSCGAFPGPSSPRCGCSPSSYSILFRGVPTILVIFILGFGMPALELQGVPNSDVFWAIVALTLVYSAYVAEVYRAGHRIRAPQPDGRRAIAGVAARAGAALRRAAPGDQAGAAASAERLHRTAEGLCARRRARRRRRRSGRRRSARQPTSTSRRTCRSRWSTS